jgi:hypothetical protein
LDLNMKELDNVLIGIRATGGFKYRERLNNSDLDIAAFCEQAERKLRKMVCCAIVAETVLMEPDGYSGENRMRRYAERVKEVLEERGLA